MLSAAITNALSSHDHAHQAFAKLACSEKRCSKDGSDFKARQVN